MMYKFLLGLCKKSKTNKKKAKYLFIDNFFFQFDLDIFLHASYAFILKIKQIDFCIPNFLESQSCVGDNILTGARYLLS